MSNDGGSAVVQEGVGGAEGMVGEHWSAKQAGEPPLLRVEGLTVAFEKFTAVRNVSFSLKRGELLGLIGPNGAGKTTLMRAICALQTVTSGDILLPDGPVLPGSELAARTVGFTPDVPPMYDRMSVRQFLEFVAQSYGMASSEIGPSIDFWLEKVWLTEKAKQKIKGLSRGMKQRLGIARTLLPNPQLVLLDEPAAGLDPAGRAQFRRLLMDLRDQGKALIVSSHILSDMEEYCTHIGIMSKGRLVKWGTVREISTGVDEGRCRYTLSLAEPLANASTVIEGIADVADVRFDRLEISLNYWSDRPRAAELLASLVKAGVPVSGFVANSSGLEAAYLQSNVRQVD